MDWAVAAGQLTCESRHATEGLRFELASRKHDAALRRLLRENPMLGPITVSLECEPDFFAAADVEGAEHQTIVALEEDRVVAAGSISARDRYINGQPMRVGYLGGLRLDSTCKGRSTIIRCGYDFFRQLHESGGPPIYLTSIVDGNLRAIRFLESGIKGMPAYRYLGEFVTLIIPRRRLTQFGTLSRTHRRLQKRGFRVVHGSCKSRSDVFQLLHRENRRYQFAPVWTEKELSERELRIVYSRDETPVACAAIWDQRTAKQSVVRGYSGALRWLKPVLNLRARLLCRPRLPAIGEPIANAFLSHLAVSPDQPELAGRLIDVFRAAEDPRSVDFLIVGFDSRDPRLAYLQRTFRPREYKSRIYVVHWEDGMELARSLDGRLLGPEVATL